MTRKLGRRFTAVSSCEYNSTPTIYKTKTEETHEEYGRELSKLSTMKYGAKTVFYDKVSHLKRPVSSS